MQIRKLLSSIFLLFLIIIQPLSVFACGGFETFTLKNQTSHSTDDTNVFVHFKDGKEIYVVQPDFTGDAKQFGVVLPFPSKPTIKVASSTFFTDLAKIFNQLPRIKFGTVGSMPPASGSGVTVVERKEVGEYSATTLRTESGEDLITWLKDNKYSYTTNDSDNFDYYVKKGNYYFVALKIKLSTYNGFLKPIAFTFNTDVPVVAMKISAGNMKPMKYSLYASGEDMFFVPGTQMTGSKKLTRTDLEDAASLTGYLTAGEWLTQATVTMNPGAIKEDLVISQAVRPETVSKTVIINSGSISNEAGIVLGASATKKTIAVVNISPTTAPITPTVTPEITMEMHNEAMEKRVSQTCEADTPHSYIGTLFWVIIIIGVSLEALAGVILYKFLKKKK